MTGRMEKQYTKEEIRCEFCKGTGKYKVYNNESMSMNSIPCKYCEGKGKRFGLIIKGVD